MTEQQPIVQPGCGRATKVEGTNGGEMPCGALLTRFGKTEPYLCGICDAQGPCGFFDPKISVDGKRIALFDGFECLKGFDSFDDEAEALKQAYAWFKERSTHVPQVVRPVIRSLKMTYSK